MTRNNTTVINIAAGTYNESIAFDKKNIALNGAGKASTFIVGNNTSATVNVFGARLDIANLTIKNGNPGLGGTSANIRCTNTVVQNSPQGIAINSNSFLDFQNGSIKSNGGNGINLWQNSSVNIGNSTISQNAGGINAGMSSSVTINGSTISQNGSSGIFLGGASSGNINSSTISQHTWVGINVGGASNADIWNSTLSGNQMAGIFVSSSSSASLQSSTVSGNTQNGVYVDQQASLRLNGGNKITANGTKQQDSAIVVMKNSMITIQRNNPSFAMDSITLNSGRGISGTENSIVFMLDGIVDNNGSDGVSLSSDALGSFTASTTITNNKGWGVYCDYSSHYNGGLGTVSGNTSAWQVACLHF